jgi:serine/threonine-protein kinase
MGEADMESTCESDEKSTLIGTGEELGALQLQKLRIRIPGYRLHDLIGRGGQATVYRAIEVASGATVAVKIFHSHVLADAAMRERLRREVHAMTVLGDCKNIVRALASGQTVEGLDYLVMNFVEGEPLDSFWKNRRPPPGGEDPSWQLLLFKRICETVSIAHRRGITHRGSYNRKSWMTGN